MNKLQDTRSSPLKKNVAKALGKEPHTGGSTPSRSRDVAVFIMVSNDRIGCSSKRYKGFGAVRSVREAECNARGFMKRSAQRCQEMEAD
jgi:hypothetical protein